MAQEVIARLEAMRDDNQREVLMRFFKTGKGQYGEGDEFLGLRVPQTRGVVKQVNREIPLSEVETLIYSRWHEVRLAGFIILTEKMKAACRSSRGDAEHEIQMAVERDKIARFYLKHARQANNWDLVDLSCSQILGPYISLSAQPDYDVLYSLVGGCNLWEQRIAIVTTLYFIRNLDFDPTLTIADMLIGNPHDLIHKAIGWMLREVGKRDKSVLCKYLDSRYSMLPRTSLRYAIERFDDTERKFWMNRR